MRFKYMICPAQDLGVSILSKVNCEPNPVFLWREIKWPQQLEVLAEKVVSNPAVVGLCGSIAEKLTAAPGRNLSFTARCPPCHTRRSSFMSWSWLPSPRS
jgi:hypothetical protein